MVDTSASKAFGSLAIAQRARLRPRRQARRRRPHGAVDGQRQAPRPVARLQVRQGPRATPYRAGQGAAAGRRRPEEVRQRGGRQLRGQGQPPPRPALRRRRPQRRSTLWMRDSRRPLRELVKKQVAFFAVPLGENLDAAEPARPDRRHRRPGHPPRAPREKRRRLVDRGSRPPRPAPILYNAEINLPGRRHGSPAQPAAAAARRLGRRWSSASSTRT